MKYNDIITVSRTDVGFVSSHRNVKFTIHRQPVWPGPRERVKNTHNVYELQLFSNSVTTAVSLSCYYALKHSFSLSLPLPLSLSLSIFLNVQRLFTKKKQSI